ncbi:hypothetical protein AGOR_G00033110 [Albula goreensis]|uniref:C1q domain-containing protein n=1 Tax=Albula goreensis TaxID=1534307 RepID=A0A8T3DWK6_9TELE|nr:hypothetical protein AGOR_G00033110 [Albula goreensis]
MRTTVVLLVLLGCCLTGVQLQNEEREISQSTTQPNIWAELKELRDMVTEQRVELAVTKAELAELKKENEVLTNMVLEENELGSVEARLRTSELQRENEESPKVAFSAALNDVGYVGTSNADKTLIYTKVFTNIGNHYNPATGIFTAPVGGVYYFTFTAFGGNRHRNIGSFLYRNAERMVSVQDHHKSSYGEDQVTNAAVLQLEEGDQVSMRLNPGFSVYDNSANLSTFSGFLLFPM